MLQKIFYLLIFIAIISCNDSNRTAEINKPTPNYIFKKVLNSEEKEISINHFKEKVVILEFWATWCGPCLPAMKKLDSLQKKFKDELEVIAISTENENRLKKFIARTKTDLRVVSDTNHLNFFKYKEIPHSIIIDKKGIVRAITNPENITEEVIKNLFDKDEIDLELKDDFYFNSNLKTEIIHKDINSNFRVELKNYDQEKRGGSKILKNEEGIVNGIEIWNSPIPRLYQKLFNITSTSRVVYEEGLSEEDFPYEKDFQYNFTVQVSINSKKDWRSLGIDFLNDKLDVNAKKEIKNKYCYVLKNKDNTIKVSTSLKSDYMFMGTIFKSKKNNMNKLVQYLENITPLPVLDMTNLKDKYDIELNWDADNIETLHKELKKYGLALEKSSTKLPLEVLKIYKKRPTY